MATTATMQPPPPPGPPPRPAHQKARSVNAARTQPPPPPPLPPAGRPPPPPPLPPASARAPVSGAKRPAERAPSSSARKQTRLSITRPKTLRDVTAYQKKHQVGQGTYGSVFMGADKDTGEIVALKRINTEQEENGFPITAIREIKILKALKSPNIVDLKEIVTSKDSQDGLPKSVYMVFEYSEFDLTGILETKEIRLTQDHVKSWSQQLLSGVHYMHTNKVIHRDLKASNLLISRTGELKIADFGLARSWNSEMKRLTNRVITLWYRPPELLLGAATYSPKIDMWSVGCIIAEMFRRSGFLKGGDEAQQLELIFRTAGHPTLDEWPDIHQECPLWKNYEPKSEEKRYPRRIKEALRANMPHPLWVTDNAKDLIGKLLTLNPKHRWSATEALQADYFFDDPIVKPAGELSMKFSVDSAHEWEARKKHEKVMAQRRERAQAAFGNRTKG